MSNMAHLLAEPITYLFNLSIRNSTVPDQWRSSSITPIAKIPCPASEADYRPISITPVLCRLLEKSVVRLYIYPVLTDPVENRLFVDQFAFRPSGSTSAALIAITDFILNSLNTEPYVRLVSLDFSKAFDTIRHSYLAEQLSSLPIPVYIHNWILSLLSNRSHRTKFRGEISSLANINASIIQGSGLGPANFVVAISGLKPLHSSNRIFKYADDCFLVILASNISTTDAELHHVNAWALKCNLHLNHSKSSDIIFTRPKVILKQGPPILHGIKRVSSINILGVEITEKFGFSPYIQRLCVRAKQSVHAHRILIAHGLSGVRLHDVVRATTVNRLLYCSQVWHGFARKQDLASFNALVRKLVRHGFLPATFPTFEDLCKKADHDLFRNILNNPGHTLHDLLPPICCTGYDLRPRSHNRTVPRFDSLARRGFWQGCCIVRLMLPGHFLLLVSELS